MLVRTGVVAGARYAFTDRLGGVSRTPYDGLNLGGHVGDDPAAVAENRRRLAASLDLEPGRLVGMSQVHGCEVATVNDAQRPGDPLPPADALVTATAGLGLVVLVADCVPVLLSSGPGQVSAATHAGRRGVQSGVVTATVTAMVDLGARVEDIEAVVGPAVCGGCYEVPAEMADELVQRVPATAATSRGGTPALDLRAGVVAQLLAAGVETIGIDRRCTVESPDQFSHRRDGVTGRFAGVVVT